MTTAPTTPAEPRPLPDWPRLPRPVDPAPILPRHPGYADQVRAALVTLGTTRDEITATLTALRVTGRPQSARGCAVYEYLLSLGLPVYRINPLFVSLIDGGRVDVPEVVGDWMAEYDANAFPALVRAVS
ncbi:hypothetical protein ACQEVC_45685 [Plantactinospora sp. CA-294935]|uniref:hypothetical protein n=1 Tax=Plantactinospora sp. CA-294935 TaxID=3240012 RepID=UPI003D908A22